MGVIDMVWFQRMCLRWMIAKRFGWRAASVLDFQVSAKDKSDAQALAVKMNWQVNDRGPE